MFKKKLEMNKEQLRDIILETIVEALTNNDMAMHLFGATHGKIKLSKDKQGCRYLCIERLQTDYNKELEIVHKRIERQIKLYYKLSQKIELLMEHLNIKFETVDEKPSVPEHLIIKKKKA